MRDDGLVTCKHCGVLLFRHGDDPKLNQRLERNARNAHTCERRQQPARDRMIRNPRRTR